tara:strand:+ start:113 stop:745 length:633 start_codon:yes stop_codon:yes gene_type:complete
MKSEKNAINRLINEKSKVSSHYFLKRNGEIILMVPDLYIAWHAGVSKWKKLSSLNKYSLGIEISNKGHGNGYQQFSKKQIQSLIRLSKSIIKKYKVKKINILGHSDIAYNRKKDPGEKFPWKLLSRYKIGIWHNLKKNELIKLRRIKLIKSEDKKFLKKLSKIGYFVEKKSILKRKNLIIAFQRRFRPELINGKSDKECLIIANKLSKLS